MLMEGYSNMDGYNNKNVAIFDDNINFDADGLLGDIGFALDLNDNDDIIGEYGYGLKSHDIESDLYAAFLPSPIEVCNPEDDHGRGLYTHSVGSSSLPSHTVSNGQESIDQSQHSDIPRSGSSSESNSTKSSNLNQSSRQRRVFTFENVPDVIENDSIDQNNLYEIVNLTLLS